MKQWHERNYGTLMTGRTPLHAGIFYKILKKNNRQKASLVGELGLIKELIETKICDVNATTTSDGIENITPLHLAAEMGHIRAVKLLINFKANIDAQLSNGQTALISACISARYDVVRELLRSGCNVTLKMGEYNCLQVSLKESVISGCIDATEQLLLHAGPELNVNESESSENELPLFIAIKGGFDSIIKMLIERGAKLNIKTNSGQSPLMFALYLKKKSTAELLIELGDDIMATDNMGATTLHYAVLAGFEEIISDLIKSGVNPSVSCRYDEDNEITPLQISLENGNINILNILLDNGVDINPKVKIHPIIGAIKNSHLKMIQHVLSKGAIINSDGSNICLYFAIIVENEQIVEELLKTKQFDINSEIKVPFESESTYALHLSAERGSVNILKCLISYGANLNLTRPNGATALCKACQSDQVEVVKFLIDSGADVRISLNDGTSPLHYAASHSSEIFEILLNHNADVNCITNFSGLEGATPLHISADYNHFKWVKLLISKGADINAKMHDGRNALILACKAGQSQIIKVLIDSGADINNTEMSIIHISIMTGDLDVVKEVLAGKPDINRKDEFGETIIACAKKTGNEDIIKVINQVF